jgi:hypothetical protein
MAAGIATGTGVTGAGVAITGIVTGIAITGNARLALPDRHIVSPGFEPAASRHI